MSVRLLHLPTGGRLPLKVVAAAVLLGAAVTAASPGTITLRRGDTLSEIARDHGTTVAELERLNHLTSDRIYAGATLTLPGATGTVGTAPTTSGDQYRVAAGDTLTGVSKRFGVTIQAMASANGLRSTSWLIAGTTLSVPSTAAAEAPTAPAGRTYPGATTTSADRHRATLASRTAPTKAQMKALVAVEARRYGVSPDLALAVAYQESGFQMKVVSAADAIGVMQVLPSTTAWMGEWIGRRLDPLDPADNITAGVLLLRWLTDQTSSDDVAVAGYYQGLGSVNSRGMLPDTKQYVSNVSRLRSTFR